MDMVSQPRQKSRDATSARRGTGSLGPTCTLLSWTFIATWDTEFIEEVGLKLLAGEAKLRAAPVILATTCNIQCMAVPSRLSQKIHSYQISSPPHTSKAFRKAVLDLQSSTSRTTTEGNRMPCDSVLSEHALREIYLMPFMLAQKYAKPWYFMNSYNRVNGTHVSENNHILQDILRGEWGFEGLLVLYLVKRFGIYSIDLSLNGGLDLEMPGINKWRTFDLMNRSVGSRKLTVRTVKERARKVIELATRRILDGDGLERTVESAKDTALMPILDYEFFTPSGKHSWTATWCVHQDDESMTPLSTPRSTRLANEMKIFISTSAPKGIQTRAKLFVEGDLVIENWTRQRRGQSFFSSGSMEEGTASHSKQATSSSSSASPRRSRHLSVVATTCRALSGPALDVLWDTQICFGQLLMSIPPSIVEIQDSNFKLEEDQNIISCDEPYLRLSISVCVFLTNGSST
ncbi:glycoside hydrolase superfamily [Suillus paluster]|uniref:glycoside hydrolase superfamily n=1 Tax=Suillus paluster TaxID=48578 RepID=UPI001B87B61F|nr:glycoside hydrolase superfamily [Suillus paluster]KAG1723479.1 glycoside hydrolase superfamily [Suillus paluster]